MKTSIRPLKNSDINECVRLTSEAFSPAEALYSKQTFKWSLGKSRGWWNAKYFVALVNGNVVGVIGYYSSPIDPKGILWTGWYAVKKEFRSKGMGSLLMEHLIKAAKKMKTRHLCVWMEESGANRISKYYSRFGFVVKGRIENYFENGDDMVYMAKRL